MVRSAFNWLGFGERGRSHDSRFGQVRGPGEGGHDHTHGVVDPTIATTSRGILAIKRCFVFLAITAALQMVVVTFPGARRTRRGSKRHRSAPEPCSGGESDPGKLLLGRSSFGWPLFTGGETRSL